MSTRPALAVVVGELLQPRLLTMFEPLAETFDVTVYALDVEGLLDGHETGLKIRLYESIVDMPGYMRGLEDDLSQSDAIVALETSRLSTFQAVRASRKYNIPLGVVTTEHRPFFYEAFQNIRAIQYDICNKADVFWATSNLAADALRMDNVPAQVIRPINPGIDAQRFRRDAKIRKKFREYIQVCADDFIILFYGDLEEYARPKDVMDSVTMLCNDQLIDRNKVRLIYAGNGSQAMELKYRSYDKGIGGNTMFLHQSPEPFLIDLYNAADVLLVPKPLKAEFHEEYPQQIIEAMACGVVPVVTSGSVGSEIAGKSGVIANDDSYQSMYVCLRSMATQPEERERLRRSGSSRVAKVFRKEISGRKFIGEVWTLIEEKAERRGSVGEIGELVAKVGQWIKEGNESASMEAVEEALLIYAETPVLKSIVLQLRGDVQFARGRINEAMESYTESVQLDDKAFQSYRGLGYVAWQSHSNEEALTFFRKALALEENDQMTILGIGLVYRRVGLLDEALFWLEKAVGPGDSARAIVALSQACLECTQPQSGIEVIERVMEVAGEKTPLLMSLGQLHINNGEADTGRKFLEKALKGAS